MADLKALHKASMNNADAVRAAKSVGCFFCIRVFAPTEVTEWCDQGRTALCPHCDIDSLLPDVTDTETLKALCEEWFAAAPAEGAEN